MRKFVVFTETDRTISVNQIIADDLWAVGSIPSIIYRSFFAYYKYLLN